MSLRFTRRVLQEGLFSEMQKGLSPVHALSKRELSAVAQSTVHQSVKRDIRTSPRHARHEKRNKRTVPLSRFDG